MRAASVVMDEGGHVLIENPVRSTIWQRHEFKQLQKQYGLGDANGHMCVYNLRGVGGGLVKKATKWWGSDPRLLEAVSGKCDGSRGHELCEGRNTKRPENYTNELADSILQAYVQVKKAGNHYTYYLEDDLYKVSQPLAREAYYLDAVVEHEPWRVVMDAAENFMSTRASPSFVLSPSDKIYHMVGNLVPWELHRVQIYRNPKQLRMPLDIPVKRRLHVMRNADGAMDIQSENILEIPAPRGRFAKPVATAIFVYGNAPDDAPRPQDLPQFPQPMPRPKTERRAKYWFEATAEQVSPATRAVCGDCIAIWVIPRLRTSFAWSTAKLPESLQSRPSLRSRPSGVLHA